METQDKKAYSKKDLKSGKKQLSNLIVTHKESNYSIISLLKRMLPVLVVIILWEILSFIGIINPLILAPPSTLFLTTIDQIFEGFLIKNVFSSLTRVLAGFTIASVLGISSGLILGSFSKIGNRIIPIIEILRPIPPIAWIPIAILWFGLGNSSAIFIVLIGAFFPIFLNTYKGIRSVSPSLIHTAQCLGASPRLIVLDVLFPASLPQIIIGLRIGIGIAWTSVIAAEMIGAQNGLGYSIQLNRTMLETEAVVVNMIIIGIVGWIMNQTVIWIGDRLTHWNQDTLTFQDRIRVKNGN